MSVLLLVGCAQAPRQPVSVQYIPDDCANKEAISRWLDGVANTPKSFLQSKNEYDQQRSEIKARMWRLRYNCNRV